MADEILLSRDGFVATLTLNRPEAANAFSRALVDGLVAALSSLGSSDARAVIVTGAGTKAFCAGADLKERASMSADEVRSFVPRLQGLTDLVAALPMPTIAAVNGAAFGGGCELALACDLRVMSSTAKIGLTETSLAIVPGAGGTARLTRLVGVGRAKELIFAARRLTAEEALALGVVERVAPPEALLAEAQALADAIAANGPLAVRASKRAIDAGNGVPLTVALAAEREAYESIIETADRAEGLRAFREKRTPVYRGE